MTQNKFLEHAVAHILKEYPAKELYKTTIVLPGNRVSVHLVEAFKKRINHPVLLPEIISLGSFTKSFFDEEIMGGITALFELYKTYLEVFEDPEDFDSFMSWGQQILNDLGDIDKYLLDYSQVFQNLQAIKDIEAWSFNEEELTELQKKFLKFWEKLGELYANFNNRPKKNNLSTNSNLSRRAAENAIEIVATLKQKKYYFIGFNAMSKSEIQLIKTICNAGLGEVLWDADEYYVNDKIQEAGLFMRRNKSWAPLNEELLSRGLSKPEDKEVYVYPARSNIDQVNVLNQIVKSPSHFNVNNGAIVLGDENLLSSFLDVFPFEVVSEVNIAMGYPLQDSLAYSLLHTISEISAKRERNAEKSIYYEDFFKILDTELVQKILQRNDISPQEIRTQIVTQNFSFLSEDYVKSALGSMHDLIYFVFNTNLSLTDWLSALSNLFEKAKDLFNEKEHINLIEIEALHNMVLKLDELDQITLKYPYVKTKVAMHQLIQKLISNDTISFKGEPLSGLQIMGLLESRAIDYKDIVIVSCNEDIIPKKAIQNSVIPYDLRLYFGLPTMTDKDAIFAYYFYRAIQRANRVHLIYNNGEADLLSSNEVSRYITQIEFELKDRFKSYQTIIYKTDSISNTKDEVEKDEAYKSLVARYFEKGISASSLNNFYKCPKDFYYRSLLRIYEDQEVEETLENSTYGTILHEVLELLYKPYKVISLEVLEKIEAESLNMLTATFDKYFPGKNYLKGVNLLHYEKAKQQLSKFITLEKKYVKEHGVITILGLEEEINLYLEINSDYGSFNVKLKGNIDRIDRVGDKVRILDYKSGVVKQDDLVFKKLSDKKDKARQLLFYAYLAVCEKSYNEVTPGNISLVKLNNGIIPLTYISSDKIEHHVFSAGDEVFTQFEEFIEQFVDDLLNPNYKIEHNPTSLYCDLCVIE